jgi:hypothetical protein
LGPFLRDIESRGSLIDLILSGAYKKMLILKIIIQPYQDRFSEYVPVPYQKRNSKTEITNSEFLAQTSVGGFGPL